MLHILLRTKIQNFFLKDINKNFYSLKLIGNFGIIKIYIKKEIHVSTEDTKTEKSTSIKKINGLSTVDASTQNSDDDVIIRVRDFAARAPWKTQKIKIKTL